MRRLLIVSVAVLLSSVARAGEPTAVPVMVTDGAGRPVPGLSSANFSVESRRSLRVQDVEAVEPFVNAGKQPVFVFVDLFSIPAPAKGRVAEQALDLLAAAAQSGDPVTLMISSNRGIHVLNDFSVKREDLAASVEELRSWKRTTPHPTDKLSPAAARLRELFEDQGTANLIPGTLQQMAALQQIARSLGRSPTSKALVWITDYFPVRIEGGEGIFAAGLDQPAPQDLHRLAQAYEVTLRELVAARVVLYPLLVAGPPRVGGFSIGFSGFSGLALGELAPRTGGKLLTNSMKKPVTAARESFGSYYLLRISSERAAKSSTWVGLKVKTDRKDVKLTAPDGVFLTP